MKTRIEVRRGSLTDPEADCDVLVNASNTLLQLGTGVSGAIRAACGPSFQAELAKQLESRNPPHLQPGEVVVTNAGTHPRARFVAHVAVMDYTPGSKNPRSPTLDRVRDGSTALWKALEAIDAPSLAVAMVVLGAGVGGLGLRSSAEATCRTLQDHIEKNPTSRISRVVFHGYQPIEFANLFDTVAKIFPVSDDTVPADLLPYVQAIRKGEFS